MGGRFRNCLVNRLKSGFVRRIRDRSVLPYVRLSVPRSERTRLGRRGRKHGQSVAIFPFVLLPSPRRSVGRSVGRSIGLPVFPCRSSRLYRSRSGRIRPVADRRNMMQDRHIELSAAIAACVAPFCVRGGDYNSDYTRCRLGISAAVGSVAELWSDKSGEPIDISVC